MQAKDFKVGQRVRWQSNAYEFGTVIEVGYCRVKVRWDASDDDIDGEPYIGIYGETGFPLVPIKGV